MTTNTIASSAQVDTSNLLAHLSLTASKQETNLDFNSEYFEDFQWSLMESKPSEGKYWTITLGETPYHFTGQLMD